MFKHAKSKTKKQEKTRRVDSARLFLYICVGFAAGILFSSGTDFIVSASRTTRPIAPVATATSSPTGGAAEADQKLLDINSATLQDLMALPGIGKAYAQAILDYREAHHGFLYLEELMDVKGIGTKRFEALRPFLTCSPPAP